MKTFPFSMPIKNYRNMNGYNLPRYGEAVWHYPDDDFVYGKFKIKSIGITRLVGSNIIKCFITSNNSTALVIFFLIFFLLSKIAPC